MCCKGSRNPRRLINSLLSVSAHVQRAIKVQVKAHARELEQMRQQQFHFKREEYTLRGQELGTARIASRTVTRLR